MPQAFKNLFFSFRGAASSGKHSDLWFDRQLEDNSTKALVYVLEHADRAHVLVPFLRKLMRVSANFRPQDVQFALQKVDVDRPHLEQRIAVGIAPVSGFKSDESSHKSGRPDAWIWMDDSFGVLMETKVRGQVSREQLQRHVGSATGWTRSNSQLVSCSWTDVYELLVHARETAYRRDDVTKLLLREIVRYIRMTSLSNATTFDLDDFGYFLLPMKDRSESQRSLLQRKFCQFADELSKSSAVRRMVRRTLDQGRSTRRLKQVVHPGAFGKTSSHYWITLGAKERRDRCHITIRLKDDGIGLEAFSPHKSFTRKFINKIAARPKEFLASLKPIKPKAPYLIRLREAHYANARSSYKGQKIGAKIDYLLVHPRALNWGNLGPLIIEPTRARLRDHRFRPEIFLVRHFELSELLGRDDVVEMVANAARPMIKYLEFALDQN